MSTRRVNSDVGAPCEADPRAFKLKLNGATVNSRRTSSDEGALQTPIEPARAQQQTLPVLAGDFACARADQEVGQKTIMITALKKQYEHHASTPKAPVGLGTEEDGRAIGITGTGLCLVHA